MIKTNRKKTSNPFYASVKKNGICLVGEAATGKQAETTNPFCSKAASGNGSASKPSSTVAGKTVRLSTTIWTRLEAQARREGKSLDDAMRQAALIWLRS